MKTFHEWLRLNEAGFFPNLFGAKKQPETEIRRPGLPEPAWRVAARERSAKEKAESDAWRASAMGYSGNSDSATIQTQPTQLQQQNKPSRAWDWPRSGGTTPFDQLYDLVGDKILPIKKMGSESNHSLTIGDNYSKIYGTYSELSQAKNYKGNNYGLSELEIDKAISIIEKMFKDELGSVAFPDDEVVVPYGNADWNPKDYHINDPAWRGGFTADGLEEPAKVIVKGFKGKRTTPAVISMTALKTSN